MKRAAAVSFALLFGSITLLAQTATQTQPQIEMHQTVTSTAPDGSTTWTTRTLSQAEVQKALAHLSPLMNTCPISLRAQQSAAGFSREVDSGSDRPKGIAQRLHLIVTNPDSRHIAAANVTVRGFADKSRVVETMTGQNNSGQDNSDAEKTFEVRFAAGSGKEVSTDLWVPGLSAVQTIELNSITYADGSTWKLAAGNVCRSPIDGMMLIGAR